MKKKIWIAVGVIAVILIIVAVVIYNKAVKSVPQDGVNAKVMRFDDLRDMRYAEVFLIGGNGITKDLQAAFYNSTGRNNSADPRNTCPAALWAKVDPEKLKEEYDVLGVFKNGPRHWVMDWIEIPVGAERNFDGFNARWFGQVQLPKGVNLHEKGSTGYHPTTVARKSQMGFNAGQPVFILEDPEGRPWVMQAYGLIDDPSLTYEILMTLDQKLKNMPVGWKYRVQVIDQDLVIHADSTGTAYIVQDELGNTYDLCDNRTSKFIT
jgi:hypothetical protein